MAKSDNLPKEDRPDLTPDIPELRSREKIAASSSDGTQGREPKGKGFYNPQGDSSSGSASTDHASGSSSSTEEASKDRVGAGYNPEDSSSDKVTQARSFVHRNRQRGLLGVAIGGLAIVIILLFSAVIPFELVTIEKDLIKDVAKIEQHFEGKASQKIFSKIVERLKEKSTGDPAEKTAIAAEDASNEVTSEIDNFPITDPAVERALEGQGLKVETDSSGNFTGLKDIASGEDVTDKIATDSDLFTRISDALPEWSVAQLKSFEPTMTEHAGSTFDGISEDTADADVDKVIDTSVSQGASSTDIRNAESGNSESNQQPPSNDTNATNTGLSNQLGQQGGEIGNAVDATNQALANGASGTKALQTGVDSFNLGDPVLASSFATMACNLKQGVTDAAKARVPLIMNLLIRHFTLILSLADQLKTNHLHSSTVNKVMQLFNGDPSATPTAKNKNPEAALPFTSSAGWQRATGGTINTDPNSRSYTPDISSTALPTANSGTKIVNELDGVFSSIPGANLSCSALTSPFGFIVQGIAGAVQFISDIGSLGASQVAISGAIIGAQEGIQNVVLPDIIKYFTPVGLFGGEDAVQWMNNSHAGGVAAFSDYSRSIGGQPLSNGKARRIVVEANTEQANQEKKLPLSQRFFALSNPDSLLTRLALYMPLSLKQMALDFSSLLTSFPSIISHDFGMILKPPTVSAAAAYGPTSSDCPGEAYGITCYGLTDSEVTKYDTVQNEEYLNTTVTYNGMSVKRLTMAGDPNQFQDGVVDSSTTDLLHCFNQSYANGSNPAADETSPDPICATMGNYDYNSLSPVAMSDQNVAVSYCDYLTQVSSSPSQDCINAVTPQLNDDIGHFTEYVLDAHVMNSYKELATSS